MGLALSVGGVVLALRQPTIYDFGMFAYSPDAAGERPFEVGLSFGHGGGLWLFTSGQLVGWALLGVGLILLAAGLGYRTGRRRASTAG